MGAGKFPELTRKREWNAHEFTGGAEFQFIAEPESGCRPTKKSPSGSVCSATLPTGRDLPIGVEEVAFDSDYRQAEASRAADIPAVFRTATRRALEVFDRVNGKVNWKAPPARMLAGVTKKSAE